MGILPRRASDEVPQRAEHKGTHRGRPCVPRDGIHRRSGGESDRLAAEARADAAHGPCRRSRAECLLRRRLRIRRVSRRPRARQRQGDRSRLKLSTF